MKPGLIFGMALTATAALTGCAGDEGGWTFGTSPVSWFDTRVIPTAGASSGGATTSESTQGDQQSMSTPAASAGGTTAATQTTATEMSPAAGDANWPLRTSSTASGNVFVDEQGMTLYTFDKDADGKSACTGECAVKWPPMLAAADAQDNGDFTVITREDGTRQWAYKGRPLYRWVQDKQAGDITGDKVGGVWHLATP